MSNKNSSISILLPIYNGIEFINDSVSSILSQTYKDWELLIGINGHSEGKNDIYGIAKEYEKLSVNIRVYKYDTKGKAATLNRMLHDCNHEWVALIDVDDIWLKDKLQHQSFFMKKYDVIGTKCVYFGDINDTVPFIPEGDISLFDFTKVNPIINSSSLIRKEICNWDEKSDLEDYDLWLRLRYHHQQIKFYNLSTVLVQHRIHKLSFFNNTNHNNVDKLISKYKD
jgi:glycosyltransferase involved in cell wall biosynthesis